MTQFQTPQEDFWAKTFGDKYTERNQGPNLIASNIALFSKIFSRTNNITSIIEFGANTGLNLKAIQSISPSIELSGLEINKEAVNSLKNITTKTYHQSIFDFSVDYKRDFVLSKGFLIHLNPDLLPQAYDIIYKTSKKYICLIEYYNPSPTKVPYRGEEDRLFKRDFAGEMLDKYKDLKLVDYGFVYRRDKNFPQDDVNWFLLEK